MKLLSILAMSLFLINCSGTSKKSGGTRSPDNVDLSCPDNYVRVPALEGYTTNDFCVMKYEAKNDDSGNAISQASGKPYVSIDRDDSIGKCTSLGESYDLITNDEWQTVARNIELVSDNWATGVIGNPGGLSRGHSDNHPSHALQASSDDTKGCEGTEQTCSNMTWSSQRRTHTLSNGEVIWDIAGNVHEWVKGNNGSKYNSYDYLSQLRSDSHSRSKRKAKVQFGPSDDYTNLNASPYGGLGYGFIENRWEGITRGGDWNDKHKAGVFGVNLASKHSLREIRSHNKPIKINRPSFVGFRCVFHPYSPQAY